MQDAFNSIRNQTNIRGCDGVIGVGHTTSDIATALGETMSTKAARDSSSGGGNEGNGEESNSPDQRKPNMKKHHSDLDFNTVQAQAQAQAALLQKPLTTNASNQSNQSTSDTSENSVNRLGPPMYLKATSNDGNTSTGWKMFQSLTSPFGRSQK